VECGICPIAAVCTVLLLRYPYWISFVSGSRCLCQISSKSVKNATVRAQTHRQRWHGWCYNLSHAML